MNEKNKQLIELGLNEERATRISDIMDSSIDLEFYGFSYNKNCLEDCYITHPLLRFGDYDRSTGIERFNIEVFKDLADKNYFEENACWFVWDRDNGHQSIALSVYELVFDERFYKFIYDIIRGLDNYPLLSDEGFQKFEKDYILEYWNNSDRASQLHDIDELLNIDIMDWSYDNAFECLWELASDDSGSNPIAIEFGGMVNFSAFQEIIDRQAISIEDLIRHEVEFDIIFDEEDEEDY